MLSLKLLSNSNESKSKFLAKEFASSTNFDWALPCGTHVYRI